MADGDQHSRRAPSHRLSSACDEALDRASGRQRRLSNGLDSSSIKWTNEKHSMYLNYIEETFVNQLYSHEYQLTDSLGRLVRVHNDHPLQGSNVDGIYCSQLTIHGTGGTEKSNFERLNCKSIDVDPSVSSSSTCVPNFISHSSGFPTLQTPGHKASSSSMQYPSVRDICHQEPNGSSIGEMTDQNFVDNNKGEKRMCRTNRNRRARNSIFPRAKSHDTRSGSE